jgi:hypothetical protein
VKEATTLTDVNLAALLEATQLNSDHRATLERIFAHPSSANIEWRQLRSLFDALGAATQEHNGKLRVDLGGEVEVFTKPRGKDIDQQTLVDLRRMLSHAGDVFVRTRPI